MAYARLFARLYGAPLLITPEKAQVIEAAFRAHLAGALPAQRAMEDEPGETEEQRAARVHQERCARFAGVSLQRRDDKPYALTTSGIALVPALGTLIQRGSWMDSLSGLTSYDMLGSLVERAMADPDVAGMVMEFDSPGGEVPGAFELQARIAAANGRKPVYGHANEMALSAAYLLASGAKRVYGAMTSHVGSIGVVMLHVDQSKRDAQMGYSYTFIHAGARKVDANPHAALSPAARAWAQAEVDRTYGLFVDAVAKSRGLSADAVRATQAAVYSPDEAQKLGLIDGTRTFAETIQELEGELALASSVVFTGTRMAAGPLQGEEPMRNPSPVAMAVMAALGISAESVSEANGVKLESALSGAIDPKLVEAKAAGEKVGEDKGKAEGQKTGTAAERERVKGILAHAEAKDRIGLAMSLAIETDMPVDQAAKVLAAAPKQAGSGTLAEMMAKVPNPKVGADAVADQAAGHARIDTNAIYKRFNERPELQ
jgi:signal peptide peptidase SppA